MMSPIFTIKDDSINGNKGFYIGPEIAFGVAPVEIRITPNSKYPEKLLVWLALSERGVSLSFL